MYVAYIDNEYATGSVGFTGWYGAAMYNSVRVAFPRDNIYIQHHHVCVLNIFSYKKKL